MFSFTGNYIKNSRLYRPAGIEVQEVLEENHLSIEDFHQLSVKKQLCELHSDDHFHSLFRLCYSNAFKMSSCIRPIYTILHFMSTFPLKVLDKIASPLITEYFFFSYFIYSSPPCNLILKQQMLLYLKIADIFR